MIEQIKLEAVRGRFGVRTAGAAGNLLIICLRGFPDIRGDV